MMESLGNDRLLLDCPDPHDGRMLGSQKEPTPGSTGPAENGPKSAECRSCEDCSRSGGRGHVLGVGGSEGVLDSYVSVKLADGRVDDFLGDANISFWSPS